MTKRELESYKKRLLKDRERLLADLTREKQEINASEIEEGDIVDIASANYDKNLLIGIMTRVEQEQLEKIDSALERIEKKTFGQCISCSKKIDNERLKVMPVSLKCFDCKRNEDFSIGGGYTMQPPPPFSSKSAAKKKTAKKSPSARQKAAAQKSSKKKTLAKRTAAKKSAKKSTAKKTAAKKNAKKSTTKNTARK